jgi:WD40 repeat protein
MTINDERLVKCSLVDGSIIQDYTSMLYDAECQSDLPAEFWENLGANSPEGNKILDTAATSDHKWLFAACDKGLWAIIDLELNKCVRRQMSTPSQAGKRSITTSVAVSPDDKLLYMVSHTGIVESYDIQAAKPREMRSVPNEYFTKITVDPENRYIFIASKSGNLYKYDTG